MYRLISLFVLTSLRTPEDILLNNLPARDKCLVIASVSFLVNVALGTSGKSADLLHTDDVLLNSDVLTPNEAFIVSNDDPVYLVCHTTPILAVVISLASSTGTAYTMVFGWNVTYFCPSMVSFLRSFLVNIMSP